MLIYYRYMWTTHKHMHGEAHDDAIMYAEILARFYERLGRLKQAGDIYREVYFSCLESHGAMHKTSIRLSRRLIDILKQSGREDECIDIWYIIFCNSEEHLPAWKKERIEYALDMMRMYEQQLSFKKAEDILRTLQSALTGIRESLNTNEVHSTYIQITIQLAQFLSRRERKGESSQLLLEIWRLYCTKSSSTANTLTIRSSCMD
jgi:hypothetical protein